MYLTKLKEKKTGKTRLFFQHQTRDKITGRKKTITVKDLGYLEDYLNKYEDPIEHFKVEAKKLEEEHVRIVLDIDNTIKEDYSAYFDLGYIYIIWALDKLGVTRFLSQNQNPNSLNLKNLMYLLVSKRLLKASLKDDSLISDSNAMSLKDIYTGLITFASIKEELLMQVYQTLLENNYLSEELYYYDIDDVDLVLDSIYKDVNQGPLKPVSRFGLIVDEKGLPIWFDTYTQEMKDIYPPLFKEIKGKKTIYVANKKSDFSISTLENEAYIIGQKCSLEHLNLISDLSSFTCFNESSTCSFEEKNISFMFKEIKNKEIREIIYWSKEAFLIDSKRNTNQSPLDGFYIIKSNILGSNNKEIEYKEGLLYLNKEFNTKNIISAYRGLALIEDYFSLAQSEFDLNPIYSHTTDHNEAHKLICFIAFIILRFLEKSLDLKYNIYAVLDSLRNAKLAKLNDDIYLNLFNNEILKNLDSLLGVNFSKKFIRKKDLDKLFANF